MVTGDPGLHGTPALSLVEAVSRIENACAITLNPNTVAKSVSVIPKTPRCATRKPVQLVRHLHHIYMSFTNSSIVKRDTFDVADDVWIIIQHCGFQMGACPTPALLEPSAPVYLMGPGSAESAQLATLAMVSSAKMLMR